MNRIAMTVFSLLTAAVVTASASGNAVDLNSAMDSRHVADAQTDCAPLEARGIACEELTFEGSLMEPGMNLYFDEGMPGDEADAVDITEPLVITAR